MDQNLPMDPALWELAEGAPEDEVDVIARLKPGAMAPPGLRVVSQFGEVVTGRIARGQIISMRSHPSIASFKAPRRVVGEDPTVISPETRPSILRRPPDLPERGKGCIVAVVDWGLDFNHPNFRNDDGSTRLIALWDQRRRDNLRPFESHYGRGRVYSREEINAALEKDDPYEALGYDPADSDYDGGSHGTIVTDIAAGNGRSGGPAGVATDADLIFVHLGATWSSGLINFGDSVAILEAIDFIIKHAENRPCAINLSMGQQGGPHDGSTLNEMALNEILLQRPGLAIIHSCGNYYDRKIHATGDIIPGVSRHLDWLIEEGDTSDNEMELWYPQGSRLQIKIIQPSGRETVVGLGERADIMDQGGDLIGRAYHRLKDPNNGDNQVDIFLYHEAPPGRWAVEITGVEVNTMATDASSPTRPVWHAWIERDEGRHNQSRFLAEDSQPKSTTGTIAHTPHGIAVAAYDASRPGKPPAPFSSSGPSRSGAMKPEIAAPGINIIGARSSPRDAEGDDHHNLHTMKSGTSMAAPHVTGTAALVLEASGQLLPIQEIRRILFETATPAENPQALQDRIGHGYLNTSAAVASARSLRRSQQESERLMRKHISEEQNNAEISLPFEATDSSLWQDDGNGEMFDEHGNYLNESESEHWQTPGTSDTYSNSVTGESLLALAEQTLQEVAGQPNISPSFLLEQYFRWQPGGGRAESWNGAIPADAAELFDTVRYTGASPAGFNIVAGPGEFLMQPLQVGDVIVTRAPEGRLATSVMVSNPMMLAEQRGYSVEALASVPYPVRLQRLVSDQQRLVLPDTLVLRSTGEALSEFESYGHSESMAGEESTWFNSVVEAGGRVLGRDAFEELDRTVVYTIVDARAYIRTAPPELRWIRPQVIPQYTRVSVAEEHGAFARVVGVDGIEYGWTASSNLGTYFKDTVRAMLAPARALAVQAGWSDRQRALANTYNRLGGLIDAVATDQRIPVQGVLAVWYVESGGRVHVPNRAVIRFENHLFWRAWGQHHIAEYDLHFQHGGRAPATGNACRRDRHDPSSRFAPWKCHAYRIANHGPFASLHVRNGQDREYEALTLATNLAGENVSLQCMSIGGPQIVGNNYRMIGYTTPREMYDAFQANERAHVLGFFDFCQYKIAARQLLDHLRAQRWEDFARGYNGAGQVTRYAGHIRDAEADARVILSA